LKPHGQGRRLSPATRRPVELTPRAADVTGVNAGVDVIHVSTDSHHVHLFDQDTGLRVVR